MQEEYVWETEYSIEKVMEQIKTWSEFECYFSMKRASSDLFYFKISDPGVRLLIRQIPVHEYPHLAGEVRTTEEGSRITARTKFNFMNIFSWLLIIGFDIFFICLLGGMNTSEGSLIFAILLCAIFTSPLIVSFFLRRNKRPYLEVISRAVKAECIKR